MNTVSWSLDACDQLFYFETNCNITVLWFMYQGKKIKVSSSQAKNKLFIGNVPHNWTQDDFKKAVEDVGPGVLKVDLLKVWIQN
jgi:hypothetical protein